MDYIPTHEEITMWKEGEIILNKIDIEKAKKRVVLEEDPFKDKPYCDYYDNHSLPTDKLTLKQKFFKFLGLEIK